jgi:hypothetical protein
MRGIDFRTGKLHVCLIPAIGRFAGDSSSRMTKRDKYNKEQEMCCLFHVNLAEPAPIPEEV